MKGATRSTGAGRGRRRGKGERGIALILVLGMLVIMTSFVAEFQYSSRVRYVMAANYRDQVQAKYLAWSGLNIYRLLILAIHNASQNAFVAQMVQQSGLDLSLIFTQIIPQLDTGMLRFMSAGYAKEDLELDADGASVKEGAEAEAKSGVFGAGPVKTSLSASAGSAGFLDFDGDFSTLIEPEDRQININALDNGELDTNPAFTALWGVMMDQKYQTMFRERNITPRELIGNLRDWIDMDGQVSAGQGGLEDNYYGRLKDPYAAKNARFTTLSEVHLVQGWDDAIYNQFAPMLTIYGNDKINPNNVSNDVLKGLIRAYCRGAAYNDALIDRALTSQDWMEIKAMAQFNDGKVFATVLQNLGLGDCSELAEHLGFDTLAYRLTSTGRVGDVERTLEVVVDNRARVFYWRVN